MALGLRVVGDGTSRALGLCGWSGLGFKAFRI